jgi:hypothetical protein
MDAAFYLLLVHSASESMGHGRQMDGKLVGSIERVLMRKNFLEAKA